MLASLCIICILRLLKQKNNYKDVDIYEKIMYNNFVRYKEGGQNGKIKFWDKNKKTKN